MGKFMLKATPTGYTFKLKASNGQTVAVSEVYETPSGCRRGANSVKVNARHARFEDHTLEEYEMVRCPKFEVYQDKKLEYRFRMRAKNGKTIAVSEGYVSKAACLNGIESVRKNAVDAYMEWEK